MAKILVVDDEANFVNLLKLHLNKRYEIITACDGEDALIKAKIECPDVITLDIIMPGINGIDVLRQLKKSKKTRKIPVILLTIVDKIEKRQLAEAFDLIKKPLDEEKLISSIEKAINLS